MMTSGISPALFELPYRLDCEAYFYTIQSALPMTVLLQSNSLMDGQRDRYDILSAAPEYTLASHHRTLAITGEGSLADNARQVLSTANGSLETLGNLLSALLQEPVDYAACIAEEIPFCGGFIGYCSYDLAREYIHLPEQAACDIDLPEMQFSFFGWACIQDHVRKQSWLVIHPHCNAALKATLQTLLLSTPVKATPVKTGHPPSPVSAKQVSRDITQTQYFGNLEKIQQYIHAGDCYQINISQRVCMETANTSDAIYWKLRTVMPSPFCSLLPVRGTESAIISFSPERFLKLEADRHVTTQPIKGTIRRGKTPEEDRQLAADLLMDSKNRAENIMIVDLLRNDLGKACETGSIRVEQLCELQSFANVHHLVSTICATLQPGLNGADLLKACFPGGSITGAPKIRAMQIIEELEPNRRSIYCGSMAYFSAHGTMDSNILIRTLLLHKQQGNTIQQLYCWGGGGIVADSESEAEYQESLTKIDSLLKALNA